MALFNLSCGVCNFQEAIKRLGLITCEDVSSCAFEKLVEYMAAEVELDIRQVLKRVRVKHMPAGMKVAFGDICSASKRQDAQGNLILVIRWSFGDRSAWQLARFAELTGRSAGKLTINFGRASSTTSPIQSISL
jgi:hypothetical protein